jgi:hypothetical protein
VECGLGISAIFLKSGKIHRNQCIGNTMGNEIKELLSMKASKHLGEEKSHNIGHTDEKGKLKECVRRVRIMLNTDVSAKYKLQSN